MPTIPATMRAVVLDAPGPPDALQVRQIAIPTPRAGEVLIKIEACGLNRSELHTRLGLNHLFQEANTGAVSEYESLDDPFADEAIRLIADWISTNT